jgi:AAA domain
MYALDKFHTRTGRMGAPLPEVWGSFSDNKITFRRGGMSLIAGQPGAFKSTLARNMLVSWVQQGMTAVYFSADSDEDEAARQVYGIISDTDTEGVERLFRTRQYDTITPVLRTMGAARFDYKAYDVDGIAFRLQAYEAVHGDYPDVVFIDNLINFASSSQDWAGMIDLQNELKALALEMRCHVCVLHHVTDAFPSGVPVPRSAIQGKVTQIPTLVLTVAAAGLQLSVASVKNRNGPAWPNADRWMNFQVYPSMRIQEVDRGF